MQTWVTVRPQEVVQGPCRELGVLVLPEVRGDQASSVDHRRARTVSLVVGDCRKVDFDDGGTGNLQVASRLLPQVHDAVAGPDRLGCGSTEGWAGACPGV